MSVDSVSGLASTLARIREITGGLAPVAAASTTTATAATRSQDAADFAAALSGARTAAAPPQRGVHARRAR